MEIVIVPTLRFAEADSMLVTILDETKSSVFLTRNMIPKLVIIKRTIIQNIFKVIELVIYK